MIVNDSSDKQGACSPRLVNRAAIAFMTMLAWIAICAPAAATVSVFVGGDITIDFGAPFGNMTLQLDNGPITLPAPFTQEILEQSLADGDFTAPVQLLKDLLLPQEVAPGTQLVDVDITSFSGTGNLTVPPAVSPGLVPFTFAFVPGFVSILDAIEFDAGAVDLSPCISGGNACTFSATGDLVADYTFNPPLPGPPPVSPFAVTVGTPVTLNLALGDPTFVPEPGTMSLLALGATACLGVRRKRR